jgi:hypothetical protein
VSFRRQSTSTIVRVSSGSFYSIDVINELFMADCSMIVRLACLFDHSGHCLLSFIAFVSEDYCSLI